MPVIQKYTIEPIWEQFSDRPPAREVDHPLGCHRPRISDIVRIFPNRESCLRLVSAVVAEISEEWVTGKRYLNMAELESQREQEVTMS